MTSSTSADGALTVLTSSQLVPLSVEYCQAPSVVAFAVLPTIAIPLNCAPVSGSERLPAYKLLTVSPGGFKLSSAIPANAALEMVGASFTGIIEIERFETGSLNGVVPPLCVVSVN